MSLGLIEAGSAFFDKSIHLDEIELDARLLNLELFEGLLHAVEIGD